jgi:hypothetical protein
MSNTTINESPKFLLAKKEGELQSLLTQKETLMENIKLVPLKSAQILFYVGLAVCATVFGLIGVGPIMVIIGINNWVKAARKRTLLQEELSVIDKRIGGLQVEISIAKASI